MRPANPNLALRLPRRRKRYVAARKHLKLFPRVLVFARRWKWIEVIIVLGIMASVGGWFGRRHHWGTHLRNRLGDELRVIGNPANLPEVLFGVVLLVVLTLWWVPKGQAAWSQGASNKNRFDRENEARKTLAQIVGGVFLLAGLYSSVKTFDLQREGQVTDRFTKAIDHLGATIPGTNDKPKPNLEVRLGGIYALERIALDSPKDEGSIMEVLTSYIQQNAPLKDCTEPILSSATKPNPQANSRSKPTPRADIQAILTVIGRRDIDHATEQSRLDLSSTDLCGADLIVADLNGANLKETHLNGANLVGAHFVEAYLNGADLRGSDLDSADLRGADLRGADLRGSEHLAAWQLVNTRGDKDTKLPTELENLRPDWWSK